MGVGGSGVCGGGQAGLGPRGVPLGVDLERIHLLEVENDPALGHAVAGAAVSTTSNGELRAGLAGERDNS